MFPNVTVFLHLPVKCFHTTISNHFRNNTSTIEAIFLHSGCDRVVYDAEHKAKGLVLQCINGVNSNPVEGEHELLSSKI